MQDARISKTMLMSYSNLEELESQRRNSIVSTKQGEFLSRKIKSKARFLTFYAIKAVNPLIMDHYLNTEPYYIVHMGSILELRKFNFELRELKKDFYGYLCSSNLDSENIMLL